MRRYRRMHRTAVAATVLAVAVVAVPLGYAEYRESHLRNFRPVVPGVLYRSGQLSPDGLKRVLHDHGIRTVVNLRDGRTAADRAEEAYCREQAVRFVRLPPLPFGGSGDVVPAEANVRRFLDVIRDPANHPVLVHCYAGVHRTGAMVAVYRMECEGWDNDRALEELRAGGYDNLDFEYDVLDYLREYRASAKR